MRSYLQKSVKTEKKMTQKRVLIVGAGASGLPAIKSCLNEGLEPVCLERSGDIGGLWNYANSIASKDEIGCVMKSTIVNTSKEMMCYSDFPIPDEFPCVPPIIVRPSSICE